MDVKDLNKSQLILLVILVTFVISIGTSIAIVSLMQEAPAEIVRPITKVIKETVEKVIRVESPKPGGLSLEEVTALVNKILLEKETVTPLETPITEEAEIITTDTTDTDTTETQPETLPEEPLPEQ